MQYENLTDLPFLVVMPFPPPNFSMKRIYPLVATLALAGAAPMAAAVEMFWEQLPGRAKDIGVGADGSAWIVGSGVGNGDAYRWDGTKWVLVGGSGVFIAVGPQGDPWVVNVGADLYHRFNNQWTLITTSGSATALGVGADGTVLITGGNSCFCGPVTNQRLYRYTSGSGFAELPGDGRAAVIEPDGDGWWSLDSEGHIYRWQGGPNYIPIEGHARDISRGANGEIWIVGGGAFEDGNDLLFRWTGSQFDAATTGLGRQISVGPDGTPWVVDGGGKIFRGHFLRLEASDVTIAAGEDLRFPVTLSFPSDRNTSVNYQVLRSDNSVASSGVLNFAPGITQQLVVLQPTTQNTIPGILNTFRLQLTNPVGSDLARATATGTVNPSTGGATVLEPVVTSNGSFVVRSPTQTGFRYELQRRTAFGGPSTWTTVTQLNGTGGVIDLEDTNAIIDQAFFRVIRTSL